MDNVNGTFVKPVGRPVRLIQLRVQDRSVKVFDRWPLTHHKEKLLVLSGDIRGDFLRANGTTISAALPAHDIRCLGMFQ